MGKNLKLNIKNAQLAASLKPKKGGAAVAEPEKKEARPSRLKEDAAVASAIKQAEKTLASRDKGATEVPLVKKPKARIVQPSPTQTSSETDAKVPPSHLPPVEERSPEEEALSSFEPAVEPVKREEAPLPPKAPTPPEERSSPASFMIGEAAPRKISPSPRKELRPPKKKEVGTFDARDRKGLRDINDEAWRKRRAFKPARRSLHEEPVMRPKAITVHLPITIKDLAHEMKLKASQLIAKLFMQGVVLTLNDYLDDETTVQLLGHEFDCAVTIDTSEKERIQITGQTIQEEISSSPEEKLLLRSPVVAFMGHVDHGKTSLIDAIRASNRVAGEAGAITQHIGAFRVETNAGAVTILDTPGHEAFSEMRSRGANVTDIVILVVAGDEGVRAQTEEAIRQAREAKVPILVALNKCDKPNFDPQKIYRELADRELLPEAWGGTTITVNCSATTKQGIKELLEMIALQAEILELRANPQARARGTVLESEMHKGMGAVATVLVQNGTLRKGDAIVFGSAYGRVKTMQDDYGAQIDEAGPSVPAKITGLSDLALAGDEFIVVKSEKEAKELAEMRQEGKLRDQASAARLSSLERMMQKKESGEMKILPVILRADVQGSLEALKNSLGKVRSSKVRLEIVNADVGEISESDIELAAASKATIVGFHTRIESHADELIKQKKVAVYTEDVIYHLIDEVKLRMKSLLDKIEQESDVGEALVKAVFKSSQLGLIAGCQVTDGVVKRSCFVRQLRGKETIWKGKIASLKRLKEDVKEVQKGFECGILLDGQTDVKEGDRFQAYEITYLEQDL